jgi:cutinase
MSGTSVSTGSSDVVQRLTEQDKACPDEKFVLVGYSQGASVMRNAAPKIPKSIYPKIIAMAMFGDPGLKRGQKFPEELQSKLFENCAPGDPVKDKSEMFLLFEC